MDHQNEAARGCAPYSGQGHSASSKSQNKDLHWWENEYFEWKHFNKFMKKSISKKIVGGSRKFAQGAFLLGGGSGICNKRIFPPT